MSPPLQLGSHGAWLEFRGVVRGEENSQPIAALEYEAYPEMAEREIRRMLESLAAKHPCLAARVIHRVGVIPAGETAILIAFNPMTGLVYECNDSGVAEIAGGVGLVIRPLRRVAGWGLIALLIAVFPANIYMLQHPGQFHFAPWILWARLPLQAVFIAWVWFVAIRCPPRDRNI
jgi:uncharacterized membrane protein